MSERKLRNSLIRLASSEKSLRPHLLPLLVKKASYVPKDVDFVIEWASAGGMNPKAEAVGHLKNMARGNKWEIEELLNSGWKLEGKSIEFNDVVSAAKVALKMIARNEITIYEE